MCVILNASTTYKLLLQLHFLYSIQPSLNACYCKCKNRLEGLYRRRYVFDVIVTIITIMYSGTSILLTEPSNCPGCRGTCCC